MNALQTFPFPWHSLFSRLVDRENDVIEIHVSFHPTVENLCLFHRSCVIGITRYIDHPNDIMPAWMNYHAGMTVRRYLISLITDNWFDLC